MIYHTKPHTNITEDDPPEVLSITIVYTAHYVSEQAHQTGQNTLLAH